MPRTPVYQQVMVDLTRAIESGQLRPGDQIPTITQLCAQYQASRQPIVRALDILADRGLIESHPGRGTYVTEPPTQ